MAKIIGKNNKKAVTSRLSVDDLICSLSLMAKVCMVRKMDRVNERYG